MSPKLTIKSFVLSDSYDAIFGGGGGDSPGEFSRTPVDGFAVISGVAQDDEVQPFELGETGFELLPSIVNYLGVVRRGEELPEWMLCWINTPHRRS
jgi:hypothetical protein